MSSGRQGGRRMRYVSYLAEAGDEAYFEARRKLRDEYYAEFQSIPNEVHDPTENRSAAYNERLAVLVARHEPYFWYLVDQERVKLGIPPRRKTIRERRNGQL